MWPAVGGPKQKGPLILGQMRGPFGGALRNKKAPSKRRGWMRYTLSLSSSRNISAGIGTENQLR
jgi:hypothetical protein